MLSQLGDFWPLKQQKANLDGKKIIALTHSGLKHLRNLSSKQKAFQKIEGTEMGKKNFREKKSPSHAM